MEAMLDGAGEAGGVMEGLGLRRYGMSRGRGPENLDLFLFLNI